MMRYADSLARQKRIKPPPGYKTSTSVCREFLNQHAPGKAAGKQGADTGVSEQIATAERIEQETGAGIREAAAASPGAVSMSVDSNLGTKRRKRNPKSTNKPRKSAAPGSAGTRKRPGERKTDAADAPQAAAQQEAPTVTPLRIPYGNKEVALRLGARYGSTGWYAPPGVDLTTFGERGWL